MKIIFVKFGKLKIINLLCIVFRYKNKKMEQQKQIEKLERRIQALKIARQYNVSDIYVRSIMNGNRKPTKKSGVLVAKALREKNLI